jgi:tetratricopeptide (TPR) repeat protein
MVPLECVRRLLRRLNDPDELRTNPLASRYFADAERAAASLGLVERTIVARIRAAVVTAVEGLKAPQAGAQSRGVRQRAIVSRCDLRGEKHESVARELGISRREFYRERRRAFDRLGLALEREFSTPVEPARIRPSEFELRLQYASSLHLVGRFDPALKELEMLGAQDRPAHERTRPLCYGVEIACDAGSTTSAQHLLDAARQSLDAIGGEHAPALCRAQVMIASGILAWRTGDADGALRAFESAAQTLRAAGEPKDQTALEALAVSRLRSADVLSEIGKPDEALTALGEARWVSDRMPHQTPLLLGDLAAALGSAHAVMTGGLSLAIDELQDAFAIYQRHNAIRRAAKISVELSVVFMQREDYGESLHYGRTAIGIARSVCGRDEYAYMCLNLSYAEARGGHPERALSLIAQAREMVSESGFVTALCTLADAEARLAARQFVAAIRVARAARNSMTLLGAERYVGAALRIEAEAHEKLGEEREAIGAVQAAIDLLCRHGHPFSLMQAYRCSARLTNDHAHRAAAAELQATLQA